MKSLLMALALVVGFTAYGYKVENLTPEAHLLGPELTEADLEGKVLLIEFFGYGCGPCVAAMPGTLKVVKEVQKKDDRFIAIASHAWPRNEPRIKAFIESVEAKKLPVYQAFTAETVPMPRGVPHAVVLNADGSIAWQGHPINHDAMKDAIEAALDALPKPKRSATPPKGSLLKQKLEERKRQREAAAKAKAKRP